MIHFKISPFWKARKKFKNNYDKTFIYTLAYGEFYIKTRQATKSGSRHRFTGKRNVFFKLLRLAYGIKWARDEDC